MRTILITCAKRRQERTETLRQAQALGLRPEIWEAPVELELSPRRHTEQTLESLRAVAPGDTLMLEDDIDFDRKTWPFFLAEAERLGCVTYFYLPGDRFYPSSIKRAISLGRIEACGLVQMVGYRHHFGSQAIYIPEHVVESLLRWEPPPEFKIHTGFDIYLREHVIEIGAGAYAAVPNPVQHRVVKSTMARMRPHRSATFGLAVRAC